MFFFASPNNPVGNVLSPSVLCELLEQYPDTYFIADEAYWEFVDQSYSSLLSQYSNLIIIRTFSKAMGAAGLRLSYVLASEGFCRELSKVTLPFLLNKFTMVAAVCALESEAFCCSVKKQVTFIKNERDTLFEALSKKKEPFKVSNSSANFISLRFSSEENLKKISDSLFEKGMVVRNVSNPFLEKTLRITVGSKAQNQAVLKYLNSFL